MCRFLYIGNFLPKGNKTYTFYDKAVDIPFSTRDGEANVFRNLGTHRPQ